MSNTEQEDSLILDQKLKKISLECNKLENYVNLFKKQAEKCVKQLDHLRNPAVRKVNAHDTSEQLDIIYGLIIKLNCELELSEIDILNVPKLTIPYISENSLTSSLKFFAGDSPWNFWLQEHSPAIKVLYKLLIEKLENDQLEVCSCLPAIGDSVCYAERRRIFRGVVTQHLGNERLKVIDVDTTCIKVLSLDKVYQVDADICHLNAQAIKCCLSQDLDNSFMWSSDLGRMFCNILRSGNLHVRICKQLPGSPPQFVVDIRVENEDEEGDLNVGEWILERVLPELKEVYVEGVENLCDFLSVKALDPYFQDNSPGIDNLQTQHTPQELVKIKSLSDVDLNIDSVENISLSANGCSSNETLSLTNSLKGPNELTMTQLESCDTKISETSIRKSVVNSKINKSRSVADLLERSLAAVQISSQSSKEAVSLDVQNHLVEHSCITDDTVKGIVEDDKRENIVEVYEIKNGCHDVHIDLEMSPFDVQTKTSPNKETQELLCTKTENVQEEIHISRELTGDIGNLHSQSSFFSLDEVTNYNYIQCLAEKLGLNEFAKFKKKHTPVMPSFISDDLNKPESIVTLPLLVSNNDDAQLDEEVDSINSSVHLSIHEKFETLDKNLLDQSEEDPETEIFKSESNESSGNFKRELTTNTDQSACDVSFRKTENNIVKSKSIESSDNSEKEPTTNIDQSAYDVSFRKSEDNIVKSQSIESSDNAKIELKTNTDQSACDVSFRKSEDNIVKSQSIESSDNAKKELTTNTDQSACDVSFRKSEDTITSKMDNLCNNVLFYSDKCDVEDQTTTLNKYENTDNIDLASGEEDKSSKTNETYYSDLSEENCSVNAVSKFKQYDSNNKSKAFNKDIFLDSEVSNKNESFCGNNNKLETSNGNEFLGNKVDVHNEDTSFHRSNDGENISSKITSSSLINHPQVVISRTVQPTMPFIDYPLTSTPPFYNHSTLLPIPFGPSQPPPYTFNPSLPRPYVPPMHPPGFWPMHQTQMRFYPPFHNQVPGPPQWGNFNTFSGPNVQYVPKHKAPETMQSQYSQWSNGVNELPSQNNVHISSEPKTIPLFKEKDDGESSQENKITDNQHELSSNTNTVSEQFSELHTPPRSFASADYFSGGLDTVLKNYHVKLKHPRTLLKPGENMLVMMAHFESPGEFYVHVVTKHNLFIDKPCSRLKEEMMEHYSNSDLDVNQTGDDAKSKYGTYCACKWPEDDYWYRVEVIDWKIGGNVLVFFVDYGNRDEVPLSTIQPLYNQFTKLAMMAQPCHLANVFPVDSAYNIWSDEATNFFISLFTQSDAYRAIVVPSSSKHPSNSLAIKLFLSDQETETISANDLMVRKGYATKKRKLSLQSNSNADSDIGDSTCGSIKNSSYDSDKDWGKFNPLEEDFHSTANCFNVDQQNANVAVTGYKGKDNSNICKFFASSGECWKKFCRWEHIRNPDFKDGVYTRAFNELKLPNPGEVVLLRITHVCSINRFFGQLKPTFSDENNEEEEEEEETLDTLSTYMNQRSNILQMTPLDVPPEAGQLVIAKSSDGFWFRSRVLGTASTHNNEVEVMYVDYGTEEYIFEKDLRQIEPRYLHLPFQAVECILANIYPLDEERKNKKGLNLLNDNFVNKTLYANIYSSYPLLCRLEIFLRDKEDLDVGEWLVAQDLCELRDPTKKVKDPIETE